MFALATPETGVWQDRMALPFRCTVHAPQKPMPQPNLVPFMSRVSLNTHRRGISAGASTVVDFPLSLKVYFIAGWAGTFSIEYGGTRRTAPRSVTALGFPHQLSALGFAPFQPT